MEKYSFGKVSCQCPICGSGMEVKATTCCPPADSYLACKNPECRVMIPRYPKPPQ